MIIRRAELGDSEAIALVLHDSFIEFQSLYPPERYAATVLPAEKVRERLQEGPGWVAIIKETVVGTVSAVRQTDGLYIRGMGTVPSARGQRIGEQLLNAVEDYAIENGFELMFLATNRYLDRAIKLYERFGFVFNPDKDDNRYGLPLLRMEKVLRVR